MRILLQWSFLFCVCFSFAQVDPVYWHLTTKDGLSSNTIYSFFELSDGQQLVASNGGVDVFWGKSFSPIASKDNSQTKAVVNLVEDKKGRIFCNDFEGRTYIVENLSIAVLDTAFWKFKFLKHKADIYTYNKHSVCLFDSEMTSNTPIYVLSDTHVISSACAFDNQILLAVSDKEGKRVWVDILDLKSRSIVQQIEFVTGSELDFYFNKKRLLIADNNYATVYSAEELMRGHEFVKRTIQLPQGERINHIYLFSDGKIGVASYDGFRLFTANFELLKHYYKGQAITKISEDREGNIWLGTRMEGVYVIPSLALTELNTSDYIGRYTNISNAIVAENKLIIGTTDGKLRAMNSDGTTDWVLDFERNIEVQAMSYQDSGLLWAYCFQLYGIDLSTGKIVKTYNVTSTKVVVHRNGIIACGTSKGIALSNDNFTHHHSDLWVRGLVFLNDSMLLLETQYGLKKMNIHTRVLKDFQASRLKAPKNLIACNNKMFFRDGATIYECMADESLVVRWKMKNEIGTLGATQFNLYVITTDGRIVLLNSNPSFWLNRYNGLFNHSSRKLLEDIEHWISITDRNIRWIPKDYVPRSLAPKLILKELSGSFSMKGDTYNSDFSSNLLSLSVQILPNASSFGESKLYYRIQGVVDDWTKIDRFESAWILTLERLPYGQYDVELYAENAFGQKSDIMILPLFIATPYYFRWPFLLLAVLVFFVLLYITIRWRFALNKRKGLELLEKEKLKLKAINAELAAIRSQMNPHFIFNSLSSIQTKILSNKSKEAYEHLTMFAKLLRSALEYSKSEYISLDKELEFIQNYVAMEQRRSDSPFAFEMYIDEKIPLQSIEFSSLILQPFVENAIVHGLLHASGDKKLTLNVKQKKTGILVEIIDNGVGRKLSKFYNQQKLEQHKSFATSAVQERVQIINEAGLMRLNIEIEDLIQGTKVNIYVEQLRKN